MLPKVETIDESSELDFRRKINVLLNQGYLLSSSSCGFVNDAKYDFCGSWQAVLVLPESAANIIETKPEQQPTAAARH